MRAFLLGLLLCLPFARAQAAEPPAVAVLPLQKAAASAQYDGLGRALAGMLVSDLSTLPTLRLVERDQLDALLSELKLGEGGFVDPKTAQKLGKGVGARFVVTGSFTVLDPTFALDARIVQVDTGEIVKAADASGTVAEFVAVEKDLVEALLDGLQLTPSSAERRKLMLQAPTERFSAFTAWGEAMARRAEGRFDEATAALNRALAEDPAFTEAQAALGELQEALARREAERAGQKQDARTAAYAAFLSTVPDERDRPAGFVYDQQALAHWALRLGILEQQGQECARYAEMRHYLDRVGWKITPVRTPGETGVLAWTVDQVAKAGGLDQRVDDPKVPEYLRDPLPNRSARLFENTPTFVLNGATQWKRSHGVLSSLLVCYPGKEALTEIDGLLAAARAAGVATLPVDRSSLTLEDHLQLWWARTRAHRWGADRELARRTEAVLANHAGDEVGEKIALELVNQIATLAKEWEDHQVRRRGLPEAEIVRRMRALAEGKLPEDAICHQFATSRGSAANWLAQYETARAESSGFLPTQIDLAYGSWSPAADFGCLPGVPPRFKRPEDAWAWYDSAHSRVIAGAPADCAGRWASFDQLMEQSKAQRKDPNAAPIWLVSLDQTLAAVVYGRCVTE